MSARNEKFMRIIFPLTLLIFQICCAQEQWSLEDCINYAVNNNITLKQSELGIQLSENQKLQSKLQILPSINATSSFNQNQGRYIDPFSNTFIEDISSNFNISSTASLNIFNGFQNINQIKKSSNEYLKSIYNLESAKNELISSIAMSYLQILFNEELYQTAEKQLATSKLQEERINTLHDAGSVAKGDLLNVQSQVASEEQLLVQNENQLILSKLQLAQLLDIDNFEKLSILKIDFEVPKVITQENINDDFLKAVKLQASIKSGQLAIKSAEYDLKIARANILPSLNISYRASSLYSDNIADMFTFNQQIDNNRQSGIYLNMNIPIFNQWAARTSIAQSKIQIINSQLQAQQSLNQLRKNMEQAYTDQLAAYKRYESAKKALAARKESFNYSSQRHELGMVNSYEFNASKNNLIKSESDELQAKYDLIFKVKLYEFYTSLKFDL